MATFEYFPFFHRNQLINRSPDKPIKSFPSRGKKNVKNKVEWLFIVCRKRQYNA